MQEGAGQTGRGLFGVNKSEIRARQLECNVRDLHFLRQRPQGAEFGRLCHQFSRFFGDFIAVVTPQPLARAQSEKQQREDVGGRVHVYRKSGASLQVLVIRKQYYNIAAGGRGFDAEVNGFKSLKGNHMLYESFIASFSFFFKKGLNNNIFYFCIICLIWIVTKG